MTDDQKIIRLLTQRAVTYVAQYYDDEAMHPYYAARYVSELFAEYKVSGMSFENFAFGLGVDQPESILRRWQQLDSQTESE